MWVQNDAILLTPLHPQPQQLGVSQTRNQAREAAGSHNQVSSMLHYIGHEDGALYGRRMEGCDWSRCKIESVWSGKSVVQGLSLAHMPSR